DWAFTGGAVGYFAYDLVRRVERLPDVPPDDLGVADMFVMITGPVVVFDHLRRSLSIVVPCVLEPDVDPEPAYWRAVSSLAELKGRLSGPGPPPPPPGGAGGRAAEGNRPPPGDQAPRPPGPAGRFAGGRLP